MPSFQRQTTLITGASAGIGLEFAKVFAEHGHPLVLVARSKDRLESLAEELRKKYAVKVKVLAKDLAKPTSPAEIFDELRRESIAVEILVNNAGFGGYGFFSKTDLSLELDMIQVNLSTLTHLTKLYLRDRPKGTRGGILNVASTAAFQPGPLMSVYYATKAYVLSFSEALHQELKGDQVTVTVLCPGHTASEFQKRANIVGMRFLKYSMAPAYPVALAGYHGLMKGKAVVIPGILNGFLVFCVRLAPRALVRSIVFFVQRKRAGTPT